MNGKTPQQIKIDERNHVEKPLLDQLVGLGSKISDLGNKQHPADSNPDEFTEVAMLPVQRECGQGDGADPSCVDATVSLFVTQIQ